MSTYPREVIHHVGSAECLLAQYLVDLVKVKLVEDFLVASCHVFVHSHAVDKNLHVYALYVVAFVHNRGWLRFIRVEGLLVVLYNSRACPCVVRLKDTRVQLLLHHCRIRI